MGSSSFMLADMDEDVTFGRDREGMTERLIAQSRRKLVEARRVLRESRDYMAPDFPGRGVSETLQLGTLRLGAVPVDAAGVKPAGSQTVGLAAPALVLHAVLLQRTK